MTIVVKFTLSVLKMMVIIVIEHDFDATTCQCRSAQERFAHFHHINCDLDQKFFYHSSSSRVREPLFVRSVAVCRTHDWELRCKPEWAAMTNASRIDHQLVFFCLAIGLVFLIHRVLTFLAVFQREQPESFICASNRVHLR